jgi:hypothetical protein
MKFISYDKSAEVLQPCKKPFNFSSASIAPQGTSILSFTASLPVWGNHFYAPIFFQFGVEFVAVVGFITDQSFRQFIGKTAVKRVLDQGYFMRRRACHVNGERKTSSVCHCHDLGAFAALGFTNDTAPFFAGANVPSIKASRKSSLPRSLKSSANVSNTVSNIFSFRHRWNHLWLVWYGGYRPGKSFSMAHQYEVSTTLRLKWNVDHW